MGVGLSMCNLAMKAGVRTYVVAKFERGERIFTASEDKIRRALEAAGATFTEPNGRDPDVRLWK
jgi:transcriptional regulator with XRE-family HTH domain